MIDYLPNTELMYLIAVTALLIIAILIIISREIRHRQIMNLTAINHQAKKSIQEEALRVADEQIEALRSATEIFQIGFRAYNKKSKKLKAELEALLEVNQKLVEENSALQEKIYDLSDELEKIEKDAMTICQSADRLILKMLKDLYQKTIIIPENLDNIIRQKQSRVLNN